MHTNAPQPYTEVPIKLYQKEPHTIRHINYIHMYVKITFNGLDAKVCHMYVSE